MDSIETGALDEGLPVKYSVGIHRFNRKDLAERYSAIVGLLVVPVVTGSAGGQSTVEESKKSNKTSKNN